MAPLASSTLLLLTLSTAHLASSTPYTLQDTYDASNFFDAFRWWVTSDPTHGFVDYQSRENATAAGLARIVDGRGAAGGQQQQQQVYLGVDYQNKYAINDSSVPGRPSVRLESMKLYNRMLMVADIEHMPTGCGTWPALWTYGNVTWPDQGEIDILEGINSMTNNEMTLHTTPGCTMRSSGAAEFIKTANCSANEGRDGCPQQLLANNSPGGGSYGNVTTPASAAAAAAAASSAGQARANYGTDFNENKGGAYVMEWTSTDINVWFLPRSRSGLFQSLVTTGPQAFDTAALGTPLAGFASTGGSGGNSSRSSGGSGSTCDVDKHFYDHTITIDTTFCGDWAGAPENWDSDAVCARKASTCTEWVAKNPAAFKDAYWLFNSIRVYTTAGSGNATTEAATQEEAVVGRRGKAAGRAKIPVYRSG